MIDARFESKKRALALTFHGTILIALSPRVSCRKIPQSFRITCVQEGLTRNLMMLNNDIRRTARQN